jgi:hypothetical protein
MKIGLFQIGFDYPDIEMKGLHLFKDKHIIIELTQNIYLPSHHLQEHGNMSKVSSIKIFLAFLGWSYVLILMS